MELGCGLEGRGPRLVCSVQGLIMVYYLILEYGDTYNLFCSLFWVEARTRQNQSHFNILLDHINVCNNKSIKLDSFIFVID